MVKYEFNWKNFNFEKVTHSVGDILLMVMKWAVEITTMAAFGYLIIAVFVSTDTEKQLRRENRAYEKMWGDMKRREKLVSGVVDELNLKDKAIYSQVFHADAPDVNLPVTDLMSAENDTIEERNIVMNTAHRLDALSLAGDSVTENLRAVLALLTARSRGKESFWMPPMQAPLKDLTYTQIAASVGDKINPFLKVEKEHDGLDVIAPQGENVFATAGGTVFEVTRSRKGLGNVVGIDHGNGYRTRYAHLGTITVSKGQTVRAGQTLGTVGISGKTYAPHLHYEVLRDTLAQDPVNYMFAFLDPMRYMEATYMSVNTRQSLD